MASGAHQVSNNDASINPSYEATMVLATLVTLVALGAIATGVMGFQGMEPFASFYGHMGSIGVIAGGSCIAIVPFAIHICIKRRSHHEVKELATYLNRGEFVVEPGTDHVYINNESLSGVKKWRRSDVGGSDTEVSIEVLKERAIAVPTATLAPFRHYMKPFEFIFVSHEGKNYFSIQGSLNPTKEIMRDYAAGMCLGKAIPKQVVLSQLRARQGKTT